MKRSVLAAVALVLLITTGCPNPPPAGAWQEVPIPDLGVADSLLTSVSCWSVDGCVAVGYAGGRALTLTRSRRSWIPMLLEPGPAPTTTAPGPGATTPTAGAPAGSMTTTTAPAPPRPPAVVTEQLLSVSCPSASFCVAVGTQLVDGVGHGEVISHYDGLSWHRVSPPPGSGFRLDSVSCTGPSFCLALSRSSRALRWDGTAWTLTPPLPATLAGTQRVSCSAPDRCVALKSFWHSGVSADLHRWDGTAWTPEWRAPGPMEQLVPGDVSCSPAGLCVMVGMSMGISGDGMPNKAFALASRNGGPWVPTDPPADLGPAGAVSCLSATTCVAMSGSGVATSYGVWTDGAGWRVRQAPADPGDLWRSLSCVPQRCVVVGARQPGEAPGQAVSYQFTP
jgi:hypothetical protein